MYLHLDEENVRKDLIKDEDVAYNKHGSDFQWVDLFASGPANVVGWTSAYTESGTCGEAELATRDKGKVAVEEAAHQLSRMISEFAGRPKAARREHHAGKLTMPMPWRQA